MILPFAFLRIGLYFTRRGEQTMQLIAGHEQGFAAIKAVKK
jgi:hypothetical protein